MANVTLEMVKTVEPNAVSFTEGATGIVATLSNNSKVFFSKLLLKPKKHCKDCKAEIVMRQEKRRYFNTNFFNKVWTKFDLDGNYHSCKKPCAACGKPIAFESKHGVCIECFEAEEDREDYY